MQDNAMGPTTASAGTATATTSDLVTTVPGKRKHTFYVTPEGEAPATTPRYAPLVEPPRVSDELDAAKRRLSRRGLMLFVVGVAVTIGTFAFSSATDGRFFIATGPMIAGIALMLRGSR